MNRDSEARHELRAWALLLLACGVVWFAVLGLRPLFNPDEGRYAEIPAEMLATGDWVVPHLDGLVYLEKPPLQYWATALAFAAFGHHEWAARLVAAATAALTLWFVYLLGRRAWGAERGATGAAMAASMLLFVAMGQLLTLDMSLSCWLTLATVAFCLAQLERGTDGARTRRYMLLCWAAMAAATLTKGLIGIVLPGAVLVLYTLLQRDFAAWRHLHLGKGLALYLALVVPWFVLVERAHPGALDFLIVREHFQRYLTRMHDRYQPWWYFLAVLAAGSLPWLPQVARALLSGWRRSRPLGEFDAARVLWVSAAFTLAFFSLSDSKLAPYIVPVLPPLALLGAARGPSALRDLRLAALLQAAFGALLAVGL
ncbi:MAG: glycosyltransferase family 39 protein, partial [Proteobacteria bacterium]|nr:glycosyltransferase family 39 protein [Pseudomonadota bacterium]